MKTYMTMCIMVTLLAAVSSAAVTDFIADTNQFGYQGTVRNVTENTGPWAFPTPRDGVAFYAYNVPGYSANYNAIQSNWYQHPLSNQNPGFFQLNDGGTVTSATAEWTQNGSLWDFTYTVSGTDATYENSWSRLWQPDQNMAWGGTFTEYTYTLTATGMTTAINSDGWRESTSDPAGITGSFVATFISTFDVNKNPITDGDTYDVSLVFDKSYWDGTNWSDVYDGVEYGNYSYFAAVPEPATMLLLGMGALGLLRSKKRR